MRKVLSEFFPEVSKDWNPTKNGHLMPSDLTYGSKKRVWWICSQGHEWETAVHQRTGKKGTGCPYCSGKKVNKDNSFLTRFPDVAKDWHPIKNDNLLPSDITAGSKKKIWWICAKGHEWETTVYERSKGSRCPYCMGYKLTKENSLYEKFPDIARQWHPNKNEATKPQDISFKSSKKVWWLCNHGHEWQTAVSERTKGSGCPYCSGRYASKENNLEVNYPKLVKEWNYNKNKGLLPEEVQNNSSKRVWWLCKKGHEWETTVRNRTKQGTKCPYCSGKKASEEYNFELFYPLIASEWDYKKNYPFIPSNFTPSSGKNIWWVGRCGHSYKSQIASRIRGRGCPYCAGKKVLLEDSILSRFPDVASEWDYDRNEDKRPEGFLPGSMTIVWWKCDKAHSWKASINNRIYKKSKCPNCYGATSFPEQAIYFYVKQIYSDAINRYLFEDKLEIDIYIPSKQIAIEYDGLFFHSKKENMKRDEFKNKKLYESGIQLFRIRSLEAPKISPFNSILIDVKDDKELLNIEPAIQKLFNYLYVDHQITIDILKDYGSIVKQMGTLPFHKTVGSIDYLVKQWHPEKNGDLLPHMIVKGSKKKAWWKCSKNHEWESGIYDRVNRKTRCPYCSNKKVSTENSLLFTYPEIAKEWHPTKNIPLKAEDVVHGTSRKVWWKCKNGHEWQNTVVHRTSRKQLCPYCRGTKVTVENSIFYTHPNLLKEWNYNKNINIKPQKITYGSTKKVWWKCKNGHDWEANVNSRTNQNQGCPYCSNRRVCQDNCLATTKPSLSREWHPTKNSPLKTHDVLAGSTRKVWWKCKNGHDWKAAINSRARGSGCPECYKLRRKK